MPKISLLVVIKGPVAIAGSIPLLSKKRGINVPIIPATIITITTPLLFSGLPEIHDDSDPEKVSSDRDCARINIR